MRSPLEMPQLICRAANETGDDPESKPEAPASREETGPVLPSSSLNSKGEENKTIETKYTEVDNFSLPMHLKFKQSIQKRPFLWTLVGASAASLIFDPPKLFTGGGGGDGSSVTQELWERADDPRPSNYIPSPILNRSLDDTQTWNPKHGYVVEDVLETWFGAAPSDKRNHHLLSEKDFIESWKKRFERLMGTFEGQNIMQERMREYALCIHLALNGTYAERKEWNRPYGLLARIVLVDQFARGLGAKPLQNQKIAEELAERIVDKGYYRRFEYLEIEQTMLPLLRSENPELQMKAARALKQCAKRVKNHQYQLDAMAAFAEGNAKAVEYFGRLPSLNKVLNRTTTTEEQAYLNVLSGAALREQQRMMYQRYTKERAERQKEVQNTLYPESVVIDDSERSEMSKQLQSSR